MDEQYFEEKKGLAIEAIAAVVQRLSDATALIKATRYEMSDLVAPKEVHEHLEVAAKGLDGARRDFEKTRWAAARTDLSFEQWLSTHGHQDLRYTTD
ncbi:hypothetical protein J2797_005541 [Paraburkholderia terricola]|nr:hypothetical protein [Paraburkholderia terricola]